MFDIVVAAAREAAARPLPAVTPQTPVEDLELSSVEAMDMIAAVEEQIGVRIPPSKWVGVETVGELVAVVESAVQDRDLESSGSR